MHMVEDLINEFVEDKSVYALNSLLESTADADAEKAVLQLSEIFNPSDEFQRISDTREQEGKLILSFNKNLVLLIQKTWVEKSDEALKEQVCYQLGEFCRQVNSGNYQQTYAAFFSILDDVVYLMFGNQAKAEDFLEYALRIDPEFGIFWWYISSLPRDVNWSKDKCRITLLLGMYFLANY